MKNIISREDNGDDMFLEKDTKGKVLTLVLLAVLFLPNIFVAVNVGEMEGMFMKKLGYLVVSLICLLLPALFLKGKAYFLFEGLFSLIVAPIELTSVYLSRCSTQFMMMDSIFNTNWGEALELLSSMWLFVLLVILVWVGYFVLTIKYIENKSLLTERVRKFILLSIPVVFLIGCVYFFLIARNSMTSESTTLADTVVNVKDMMTQKFRKIFPFSVYIASEEVWERRAEIREGQARVKDFRFGLKPKDDTVAETYVLVIGETARKHNFGLYGYHRNTTPLLSQKHNFVAYDRFVTQANLTSNSIPLILSRADASHSDVADRERSLPEAFSEAGFRTAWITDQDVSVFQQRIMDECDDAVVLGNNGSGSVYDMDLIPALDSLLRESCGGKNFIVLHSLGSHFRYNQRYPSDFEIYKPCFGNSMDHLSVNKDHKEELMNAYDNSILYTDYFLSHLMDELEARCGVWMMVYLSDHGENLFDDERELVMHGTLPVSEYEANIPFFISYSDAYRERYPEKVEHIVENRGKNVSSEVLFHSFLDFADIRSEIIVDSLSLSGGCLKSMDSTYILNGNRIPVVFDFKRLDVLK